GGGPVFLPPGSASFSSGDDDLSRERRAPLRLAAAALALAAMAIAALDASRVSAQTARDTASVIAEADAAFEADQHDRALALYQEALQADPRNLGALRRAGLLLGWAGRAKEAAPLLERAVAIEPGDRATRLQLARVYSWGREWDKSLAAYDALLAEDSSDVATAVE